MKKLFKLEVDCCRQGTLHGLFIAEEQAVNDLIESKRKVYFGEVLGKYSEIFGNITKEECYEFSSNETLINQLREIAGSDTIIGYNPFNYIDADEEDEE